MDQFKATLMDEATVRRSLKRIAHEIVERNNGVDNLVVIGIHRRGEPLAACIADHLETIEGVRPPVGSLDITFYRDDLKAVARDPVIRSTVLPCPIEGKIVILVDDVLYTGRTVRAALDALSACGRAAGIQLAVLVDRGHRELPIRGDYVGKNIPTARNERVDVHIPPFDEVTNVELYESDGDHSVITAKTV